MKIIKGNFSDNNKGADLTKQKLEQQGYNVSLNEDTSYSGILIDLIKPYLNPKPHADEVDDKLPLAIIAWNMAISKSRGVPSFKQVFDMTMEMAGITGKELSIVKQIMKVKQQKYAGYDNFIENYNLNFDDTGTLHVSVMSKPFVDFMDEAEAEGEEIESLQYEEGFVNRNALLVKPKPAFWDWMKAIDKTFTEPQPAMEHTIYLIHEKESDQATVKWLKQNFDTIFMEELDGWITSKDCWPAKRTYKMFCNFFSVEFHSMIMDLEKEPLMKE